MANTQPIVAVKDITITNKTKNSISICWNKATDKESPQSELMYTVTWCVAPYVWDNNIRKIGERKFDNSSYTITGLKPNTTYEIIVYVRDPNGYENTYARTKVTTLPDAVPNIAPYIPNKVVVVSRISTNSIELSWQKATDKETAQKDLRYVLTWTQGPAYDNANRKQGPYLKDADTYKITGLFPNTSYHITVWVHDGEKFSQYNSLHVTTASSAGSNTDEQRRKEINSGLASIAYRPADLINNDMYNDKTQYPDAFESLPDREFAFILDKKPDTFSEREIYVRGSGYENIYPGAILVVDDQITSGTPHPLGRIPRNKISIYGDFLAGGNPSQSNVSPNNSDVREATNRIMQTLLRDSRYEAPGVQRPRTKIHTSQKSLMMDLNVDSSFAGCNVNVKAKASSSEQSFIQATTLDQDYFTIKLKDNWKQDPSSLFDKSVTWQQLSNELRGKAIAIVTSVTYGRTFSYMKEYSAKNFTFDSSQKVSGYGQTANASQSLAESSSYTNDEIFNLGGTGLTISVLRSKRSQAELEKAMSDNMKFGPNNQGVVTKYTIQLITGAYPGKIIRPLYSGTQYRIGYTRCPRRISAKINVKDVRIADGHVKVQLDVQCFRVKNGTPVIFKIVNGNSPSKVSDPWWYKFQNSRTREYGDLQPGEYIYKNPLLRIRTRFSRIDGWDAQDERRLNHGEIETGAMEIVLKGSVFRSVRISEVKAL
ncbi:fibronectin type III domain protein [Bacteroides pyogenes F0041]|uniref:Fibronectin type III domain protein n=1 Tax=Bacteroides pyogenes F0041 TaxID=1321819 RepID=U2DWF9_9BACE|nr:thiol-activated cytolysin family protein [Bacteroides pyogenes]ERI85997.1 fibronectin type III domain protein [Bacteroides pyogenes F0041]